MNKYKLQILACSRHPSDERLTGSCCIYENVMEIVWKRSQRNVSLPCYGTSFPFARGQKLSFDLCPLGQRWTLLAKNPPSRMSPSWYPTAFIRTFHFLFQHPLCWAISDTRPVRIFFQRLTNFLTPRMQTSKGSNNRKQGCGRFLECLMHRVLWLMDGIIRHQKGTLSMLTEIPWLVKNPCQLTKGWKTRPGLEI